MGACHYWVWEVLVSYSNFAHQKINFARLFLMWHGFQYDFWLLRRMHPEGCDLEIAADQ